MSYWFPKISRGGAVASGNGEILVDGRPLEAVIDGVRQRVTGHSPHWFSDNIILTSGGSHGTVLVNIQTGDVTRLPGEYNPRVSNVAGISAGAGKWCGWNGHGLTVNGILYDSFAAPGAIDQETGWLSYLTPYHGWDRQVRINGETVHSGPVNELQVGDRCACWQQYDGTVSRVYGWSPETGVRAITPLPITEHALRSVPVRTPHGLWATTDTHRGLIVHSWSGHEGYILEGDYYYHDARWIAGRILIVATDSKGNPVREDLWLSAPQVDLSLYRPSTARPIWAGYFYSYSDRYGDSPNIPPGNCTVIVEANAVRRAPLPMIVGIESVSAAESRWHDVVAAWVSGGTPEEVMRETQLARDAMRGLPRRPVISYLDGPSWSSFPEGIDWLGLQCYCDPGQSLEAFEKRVLTEMARIPPDQQIALVVQAYSRNGQETDRAKMIALQRLWPRLASDWRVQAVLWFADRRPTGTLDFEQDWRGLHLAFARSIPRDPDIVTLEDENVELKKPEVTVDDYKRLSVDGGRIVFHDRENPELNLKIEVWNERGSIYARIQHKGGEGRTGDPNRRV